MGPSDTEALGHGLYFPSNLINHSCLNNSTWVNRGRLQFVVAFKKIKKGEPITVCYNDEPFDDASTRQNTLSKTHFFTCECELCLNCKEGNLCHELDQQKLIDLQKLANVSKDMDDHEETYHYYRKIGDFLEKSKASLDGKPYSKRLLR